MITECVEHGVLILNSLIRQNRKMVYPFLSSHKKTVGISIQCQVYALVDMAKALLKERTNIYSIVGLASVDKFVKGKRVGRNRGHDDAVVACSEAVIPWMIRAGMTIPKYKAPRAKKVKRK